jgi:glutamine synthetase
MNNLLHVIPVDQHDAATLKRLLTDNPQIKFVSLMAVDLGNNSTDEKIPIRNFMEDIDGFLKQGAQTDGSSVYLPKIAEINNAKVDLIPDLSVKWLVDYNISNRDPETQRPVGTLVIPAYLYHDGIPVCSRSILKRATEHFKETMKNELNKNAYARQVLGIEADEQVAEVYMTMATELEFWVKTPNQKSDYEKLSASQTLKEQYWKRTVGPVRTALEQSLIALEQCGFEAEMGHKEVGGVPAQLAGEGQFSHIMEQLEIDWKYDEALQSADNELFAREIIQEVFFRYGLKVTFRAKPIEGVAGSGEHHHLGVAVKLSSGRRLNLFAPKDMKASYINPFGWGALMGVLKNYEVVNPFVTSSNDAFNRLKPGFEAPVCTVASVGHTPEMPARNRTVLIGLVRDTENPLATRFELRAPNPMSNTYLLGAAAYQAMLDGILYVLDAEATEEALEKEISKVCGEEVRYLEKDRAYRSEEDVFEHYSGEERDKLFGLPPRTVWENLRAFERYQDKVGVLTRGQVFPEAIIESYRATILSQWIQELTNRVLPTNEEHIRRYVKLHGEEDITDLDIVHWEKIRSLRNDLMKNSLEKRALFARIKQAMAVEDFELASELQVEMMQKMTQLKSLYLEYRHNLFTVEA